jgi:hypothetical protein
VLSGEAEIAVSWTDDDDDDEKALIAAIVRRAHTPQVASFADAALNDRIVQHPELCTALLGACSFAAQLEMHDNQLTRVPSCLIAAWAAGAHATSLRELSLDHNRLIELPAAIGYLSALENLTLHDNELRELPADIGRLRALQQLRVDRNRLRTLPSSIGALTGLTALHLDGNELQSLPDELGQCAALQDLQIGANTQLRALPPTLAHCESLILCYGDRPPNVSAIAWESGADAVRAELRA